MTMDTADRGQMLAARDDYEQPPSRLAAPRTRVLTLKSVLLAIVKQQLVGTAHSLCAHAKDQEAGDQVGRAVVPVGTSWHANGRDGTRSAQPNDQRELASAAGEQSFRSQLHRSEKRQKKKKNSARCGRVARSRLQTVGRPLPHTTYRPAWKVNLPAPVAAAKRAIAAGTLLATMAPRGGGWRRAGAAWGGWSRGDPAAGARAGGQSAAGRVGAPCAQRRAHTPGVRRAAFRHHPAVAGRRARADTPPHGQCTARARGGTHTRGAGTPPEPVSGWKLLGLRTAAPLPSRTRGAPRAPRRGAPAGASVTLR